MPDRIKRLPVYRGYPVPWFVAYIEGEPEFRAMEPQKWVDAVAKDLCWVCGDRIGRNMVFVLGPMCGVTRTTSEPPCHRECAIWAACNCPFLNRPHMVRREVEPELKAKTSTAGEHIDRNPGVALLWTTKKYTVFRDAADKPLIRVGDPDRLEFFAAGRKATRAEIDESVRTGLPFLQGMDPDNAGAQRELTRMLDVFTRLLPTD